MYLSHLSPSAGVNGSVAMNHGVTCVDSPLAVNDRTEGMQIVGSATLSFI
jgi:hypothetical protein